MNESFNQVNPEAQLPPPHRGEHFALGGQGELPNATAVHKEAAKLSNEGDASDTFYPTESSRVVIKKLARGEELSASDVIVNRTVISQARKNVDRYKPKEQRTEQ